MKTKRILTATLAMAMAFSLSACGDTGGDGDTTTTSANAANTTTTLADLPEAEVVEIDETQETGVVRWLGYYDLETDQVDHAAEFLARYGGTLESEICSSGAAYFERLGVLVSSDMSPDLVRYEWMSYPHGITKNLYTPLDSYLDIDSPLWEGVREAVDGFTYGDKHYYFPQTISTNFALNYNKTVLEYEGFDDPMDLYLAGDWTWNTFKSLIVEWCNLGEEYIGYTGVGGMSFVATTGVKTISVESDGDIINNMKNQDLQRCMEFLEGLYKENLVGEGYVSPQEAFLDGKLLFLGMDPTWTYGAAQEALTKAGVENDMAVLPFPRDPNSETYSIAYDTYGYMIPSGAKNVKGAVDWIVLGRTLATDPETLATAKEDAIDDSISYYPVCAECRFHFVDNDMDYLDTCPECDTPRRERFKVVYTEQQYDILQDMQDFSKFNLIFDDVFGFGTDLTNLFNDNSSENGSLLDGPIFLGSSYTQLRDIYFETVEGLLQPYRDKMRQDIAG